MTLTLRIPFRRSLAWILLAATLQLTTLSPVSAAVVGDYKGTTVRGRPSVAVVTTPGDTAVNTLIANLYHSRDEIFVPSEGIPLDFRLHYNSFLNLDDGPFGFGWTASYDVRVVADGSHRIVYWGDGRRDRFVPAGGGFSPVNEAVRVVLSSPAPGTFRACTPQQVCFHFDDPVHGRVTSISDPSGNAAAFTYDSSSRLVAVSDAHGFDLLFHYDPSGHVAQVVDMTMTPSRVLSYGYDSEGNLVRAVDPVGNVTTYAYACPHLLVRITDPIGTDTSIAYSPAGQVVTVDDGIQRSEFAYDAFARRTTARKRIAGASYQTTTYQYDASGRLVRERDALGGEEISTYDAGGYLASVTSPGGRTTTLVHDPSGDLLSRTDPLGATHTFTYDPTYHKVTSHLDPSGHASSFTYDAAGRIVSATQPTGESETWTYDAAGRTTAYTDQRGNTTAYEYDAVGDLARLTKPGAVSSSQFEYDPAHRMLRRVDPLGHAFRYQFDAADRLLRLTNPLGGNYDLSWDPRDLVDAFTDPDGRQWTFSYDGSQRLTTFSDPLSNDTTYGYDDLSRIVSVTDPGGHATAFAYDALGRRTGISDPLGNTASFAYDADGNQLSRTAADGAVTTYTYDGASRLTQVDYAGSAADDAVLSYDVEGRLTRVISGVADLQMGYDSLDRVVSVLEALSGRALYYLYDANGNRTGLTDSGGGQFSYTYDAAERLVQIVDPLGRITTITYDAAGRPATVQQPNLATATSTYDAADRLVSIQVRRPDLTPIFGGIYGYDAAGNRTSSTENGVTVTFTYDAAARLVQAASTSGRVISYTYDADGNRIASTDSLAGAASYVYDAAERLVSSSGAGAATYSYDAKGNRTSRTSGAGVTTYAYDDENRLSFLGRPDGSTVSYAYDPLGRRQTRSGPGPETLHWVRDLVEGGNVVEEYDAANSRVARYTSAQTPGSYLTYEGTGSTLFLHGDRLRTVRAATDAAGVVQASFEYLPFGEPAASTGSIGDRAFTGADAGDMPELLHLRARDYDTSVGRFLQRDPIFGDMLDAPNFNPYLYTGNSPQTYTDPEGEWFLALIVVVAVVLVVVAVVKTVVAMKDAAEKAEEGRKARTRHLDAVQKGDERAARREQKKFDEALKGVTQNVKTMAENCPHTMFTGAAGVPTNKAEAAVWTLEQGLQKVNDATTPDPQKRKPAQTPSSDRGTPGPTSYNSKGANSRDGIEASSRYGDGARTGSVCGVLGTGFTSPGAGQVFGVELSPTDTSLYLVGEGAPDSRNLQQVSATGVPIRTETIAFIQSARGISKSGAGFILTNPNAAGNSVAILTNATATGATALWAFSGPSSPNPPSQWIPQATDVEPIGVGPGGGIRALVSSAAQPVVWEVELQTNLPPPASSQWQTLSVRTNPAGTPISALAVSPSGLISTFNGSNVLHNPATLAVVGTCPALAGPSSWGVAADGASGTVWNTSPPADVTQNGAPPSPFDDPPLPDSDGDGHPGACDNCPEVANPGQIDTDGDGWGDLCECAPTDPNVNPGARELCGDTIDNDCDGLTDGASPYCIPVAEVTGLRLEKSEPAFHWNPLAGVDGYDLIRARLDDLAATGPTIDLGAVTCLGVDLPTAFAATDPLSPAPGHGFGYLVRVHHGLATFGFGTGVKERLPASGDCPAAP